MATSVYAFEQVDLRTEVQPVIGPSPSLSPMDGVVTLEAQGSIRAAPDDVESAWPYRDLADTPSESKGEAITITAMPYLAWANREPGPMRVWLPASGPAKTASRGGQ